MRRSMIFYILLSLIGFSFSVGCGNLSYPGTYTFTSNQLGAPLYVPSFSSYVCIMINSSNVMLNCNSYNMTNNASGVNDRFGVFVIGPVSNVTVKNCGISNYTAGVIISNGVTGSDFISNTIYDNNGSGLLSDSSSGNNYTSNTVYGNSYSGFTFQVSSDGNVLTSNEAYNNTLEGFDFEPSANNNNLSMNDAYNNSDNGFLLNASSSDYLSGNNAHNNTNKGFFISSGSDEILSGNSAYNNSNDGYELYLTTDSNITGNSAYYNDLWYGFRMVACNGNNLSANIAYNNTDGFLLYSSNGNMLTANNASNNSDTGFIIEANAVGNVLNGDNAFNNTQEGFVVSADFNNLTGNNAYNNSGDGFDISTGLNNSLIGNNACFNVNNGFEVFSNADNNTLYGNNATNNSNDGFLVDLSSYNNITGDGAWNNTLSGFDVESTRSNIFVGDNAGYNLFNGFNLDANNFTTLLDSTAQINHNDGFELDSMNGYSDLEDNLAYNNSNNGFEVNHNFLSFFFDDNATYNPTGYFLDGGSFTRIEHSNINNNGNGLSLYDTNITVMQDFDHFNNNSQDINVSGPTIYLNMSDLIFDGPAGNYTNFTRLSIFDTNAPGFIVNWTTNTSAIPLGMESVDGKFVSITNTTPNVTISQLTWTWFPGEVSAGNYTESHFQIWRFDSGIWMEVLSSLDTAAHTLTVSNLQLGSVYALLQNDIPPPSSGGASSNSNGYLVLSEQQLCPGNEANITVKASGSGNPVPGATVTLNQNGNPLSSATTGSDGSAILSIPSSGYYTLTASANTFSEGSGGFGYTLCSTMPQCTTDQDCMGNQSCSNGQCFPVNCPSGQVVNHKCQVNKNQTSSLCTSDSQCSATQNCQQGECIQVTGACGYAANHTFVKYQCGSDPSCPSCPGGQSCLNNQCVPQSVNCSQSSVTLGSQVSCSCAPAQSCSIILINPDGSNTTLQTTNGQGQFTPTSAGQYQLVSGQAMAQVIASAPPQNESAPPPSTPAPAPTTTTTTPPADYSWLLWVVLLVIVLGVGYIYWRNRKK